jgi:hypothetical protein
LIGGDNCPIEGMFIVNPSGPRPMSNLPGQHQESRNPATEDRFALYRLAWFLGVAVVLALTAPHPLFAATLSSLLGLGSLVVSLAAFVLREPVAAGHFTRWDVAAVLYLLSAFFGWFVNRAEIGSFLRSQGYAG